MSTQVTPPYSITRARPTEEYSRGQNNHLTMIEQAINQLYLRTGGPLDAVDDSNEESSANENQIAQLIGMVSSLSDAIADLQNDVDIVEPVTGYNAVTIFSSFYTAVDQDFVNAKGGATIALPENPQENAVIIIRNGDGSSIKLNGNGKTINGSSTGTISQKGTALVLHYFIDSDEWLVR